MWSVLFLITFIRACQEIGEEGWNSGSICKGRLWVWDTAAIDICKSSVGQNLSSSKQNGIQKGIWKKNFQFNYCYLLMHNPSLFYVKKYHLWYRLNLHSLINYKFVFSTLPYKQETYLSLNQAYSGYVCISLLSIL